MLPGILLIGGIAVGIAILTSPLWLEYMEMDNWRHRITLVSLGHTVFTTSGEVQRDGVICFDTAAALVEVNLSCPEGTRSFPFKLVLQILYPSGAPYQWISLDVGAPPGPTVTASFPLNASVMRNTPGTWRAFLHMLSVGTFPFGVDMQVSHCRNPESDLKFEHARITTCRAGRSERSDILLMDSDSVKLAVFMLNRTLPPDKFTGLSARLKMTSLESDHVYCLNAESLGFQREWYVASFDCRRILTCAGLWDIKVDVGDRVVYRGQATVVSRDEVARGIEVHSFTLEGRDNSGGRCEIGELVYTSQVHTLVPHVVLSTVYPSSLVDFSFRFEVKFRGDTLVSRSQSLILVRSEKEIRMDGFSVPQLLETQPPETLVLELFIGDQCLVRKPILAKPAPPRCAVIQGRLLQAGLTFPAPRR